MYSIIYKVLLKLSKISNLKQFIQKSNVMKTCISVMLTFEIIVFRTVLILYWYKYNIYLILQLYCRYNVPLDLERNYRPGFTDKA